MVVNSAFVSYAGATSTISAETMWSPSRPLKMVRSSRVDQPPVSGVPVAGANAGSMESIYAGSLLVKSLQETKIKRNSSTYIDRQIYRQISNGFANLLYDSIGACKGGIHCLSTVE